MKAYRFHEWLKPAQIDDNVPVPEPGPGEVLIKIAGAGVCASDLHLVEEWTPETMPHLKAWSLPLTLGHENGGWIAGGDTHLDVGTPVIVNCLWHCGECDMCRRGLTNYCEVQGPSGKSGGLGFNGGMAEYMAAPVRTVVPLRDLDPAEAAPLTDAGLTSYHAVKSVMGNLMPGSTAVVIGVGGLGHVAVEILSTLTGAQIIAVDRSEAALQLAKDRGAHVCLNSDEHTVKHIFEATLGKGADAVLEMVNIDATMKMAANCLRAMGKVSIVGVGGGTFPMGYTTIQAGGTMFTTVGGSMAELSEVVALAEAGRIKPHVTRYKLEEAGEVFDKLHHGKISGRAVLVP